MQLQQPARAGAGRRAGFANLGELDDLIALARTGSGGRSTAPTEQKPGTPVVAPAPEPVIELPTERNALFAVYRKMQRDLATLAFEARKVESHLFGDEWDSVIKTPETKDASDIAYLAMENLILQAEKRYAPVGGTLTIDRNDVWTALGLKDRHHWRYVDRDADVPFDLDKLYAHLEATYGGDAGETAAYQQQAKELIDFFGFNRSENLIETARNVECSVRIWSSKKDYAPKGTLEVNYNSQERIRKAFHAFACAMAWAGKTALQAALMRSPLTGYGFTFMSRHRETYPGMTIVLFKEKWQIQLDHDVAAQLKLFLGQYGV